MVLVWGLAGLGGACQEYTPPPVVFTGRNLEIGVADGLEVCGGTFRYMDDHVDALWGALHLPRSGGRFRFSYVGLAELEAHAPCKGQACATPDHVYSSIIPWNHEHVHVVRQQAFGSPLPLPSVFEEGLAEVYGDGRMLGTPDVTLTELLDEPRISGSDAYLRAGHAVNVLLERKGIDVFNTLSEAAPGQGVEAAFVAAYGQTLEAFVAEYEREPQCQQVRWRRPLLECSARPEPWVGGEVRIEGVLECGGLGTVGPRSERMWTYRTLEIEDTGSYALSTSLGAEDDAVVRLVECDAGCGDATIVEVAGLRPAWLEAGRYYVLFERGVGDPGGYDLTLRPG